MKIHVEKFPPIRFRDQSLVWDSRQPQAAGEWVLIHLDAFEKPEIRKQLLGRAGARFIGPPGSGLDLEVSDTRKFLGWAASAHFGYPSSRLKVFAVTGTNGKTTCSTLLRAQLVQRGLRVVELGTLGLRVFAGNNERAIFAAETGFTTADAPTLHHLFSQFLDASAKIDAVVMEASSHASTLARVAGVDFDGMLYTNLTQDHLDFHGTMEAYEDAKARLFWDYLPAILSRSEEIHFPKARSRKRKTAAINLNDPAGARLFAALPSTVESTGVSVQNGAAARAGLDPRQTTFRLLRSDTNGTTLDTGAERIESPLIGEFNAENLAGSYSLLRISGLESSAALKNFLGAEGRMQRVSDPGAPAVFVDYSHTPDALEKALMTLHRVLPTGARLVVAFGCGGDRDAGKRPAMGAIAARIADAVILCSDNPRTEDPFAILKQIEDGVPANLRSKVKLEENRRRAIELGIAQLGPQDALIIAGKGHEEHQIIGTTKHPFSDITVAREILANRRS